MLGLTRSGMLISLLHLTSGFVPGRSDVLFSRHAVMRRRVAQGWADQGLRLSERSEFEQDPARREQRSLPAAKRRGDESGSPFFCLLFFGEAKKSECAVGRMP